MKKILVAAGLLFAFHGSYGQQNLSDMFGDSATAGPEPVTATFKSTTLINGQSSETMHRHNLLFVVAHRFGDIAGKDGGIKNFFGMDNIYDVQIGFEYGLTDRLTAGIGRDKGAPNGFNTDQYALYYGLLKYKLLEQRTDDKIPITLTVFGRGIVSTMHRNGEAGSDGNFDTFSDRLSGTIQLILARKFSDHISLELAPTWIRRNLVSTSEMQDLFSIGVGGRVKISRHMAIVADYYLPLRSDESTRYYKDQYDLKFYPALGVGLEIETGGHIFHIDFTNATSAIETQFIPSTTTSWGKGQFRWGFNLSRTFLVGAHRSKK